MNIVTSLAIHYGVNYVVGPLLLRCFQYCTTRVQPRINSNILICCNPMENRTIRNVTSYEVQVHDTILQFLSYNNKIHYLSASHLMNTMMRELLNREGNRPTNIFFEAFKCCITPVVPRIASLPSPPEGIFRRLVKHKDILGYLYPFLHSKDKMSFLSINKAFNQCKLSILIIDFDQLTLKALEKEIVFAIRDKLKICFGFGKKSFIFDSSKGLSEENYTFLKDIFAESGNQRRRDIAQLLLILGAKPDGEKKDWNEALYYAVMHIRQWRKKPYDTCIKDEENNKRIARLLLEYGANINALDSSGSTFLHDYCLHSKKEIIEFLLANDADPNSRNTSRETPLSRALNTNSIRVAQLLVDCGADINAKASTGRTMLEHFRSNEKIVKFLLDNGAQETIEFSCQISDAQSK